MIHRVAHILLLLPALIFAVSFQASAESLRALEAEALAGNSGTFSLVLKAKALRSEALFAETLPNPTVSLGLANLPLTGFSLNQEPMTQKQLAVTQKFPWPGKRELAAKIPEAGADVVDEEVKIRLLELLHGVRLGYFELWYQAEKLKINDALQGLVAELTESAAARYESGRETQEAFLKGELELARLAEERLVIEGKMTGARSRLLALLERRETTPMSAETPDVPEMKGRDFWIETASESPRRKRLLAMVEGRSAGHALAEKAAYPDLGVKVSYGQREDDDNGRGRDDFISMTLSIPVPLWKAAREESMVAAKGAEQRAASRTLAGYDASLPHRIDGLLSQMETSLRRYRLYRDDYLPKARQLSETLVSRYEVGAVGYDAMIKSVTETMRAEVMALSHLKEALVAESSLKTLVGALPKGEMP